MTIEEKKALKKTSNDKQKDKRAQWKKDHKEQVAIQHAIYRAKHKDRLKNSEADRLSVCYESNKEVVRLRQKVWRDDNKDYTANRCAIDPLFKLSTLIRSSIGKVIRNNGYTKRSRTTQILGCSFIEFKQHIEQQFEWWMTWDNRGSVSSFITGINQSWDIDHIIPLASATTEAEIIKLNHYTNLQPLCSYTNRWIKRDHIVTNSKSIKYKAKLINKTSCVQLSMCL